MPDATVSKEVLTALMRSGPLPCSIWQHVKGGIYTVVLVAIREEDLTPFVVYRNGDGIVWVRPLTEFLERFKPAKVAP